MTGPRGALHPGLLRRRLLADRRHPTWLLLVCLVGMFSTTFPATILTIAVKPIADELGSRPTTVTWVTTAPLLAAAVATPVLGRLGDLRGHRQMFLIGLSVAATFAVLTALAWNATSLIAFRTCSQLGAAATVPSTFAMLFRSFPSHERVRASALASATLASAAVVGVVIVGPLTDSVGWRPIFLVQAGIAVVALLPAVLLLPDDGHRGKAAVDYPGAAVLAVAAFCLTFGINRLGVWGPRPVVLACLVLAPAAGWLLLRIERRATSPILPLHVLFAPATRVIMGATFVVNAAWMGNFVVTPLLMQSVMGLSAGVTSLLTVPRATFIALSSPAASRLGRRFDERRLVLWAALALALVLGVLAVGAATTSVAVLVVGLAASGWAYGHVQPGLLSAMGGSVREEDFGLATSLQQTASQIGAVVGIGAFTAVAADATTPGPFVVVYVAAAVMALICALVISRLRTGPASVGPDLPGGEEPLEAPEPGRRPGGQVVGERGCLVPGGEQPELDQSLLRAHVRPRL
ncbi:MAG: major facilitator superfamily 1 [Frankiales bacterium]|nr:major facilitator superfamily 1 [Frankiales bacterium]